MHVKKLIYAIGGLAIAFGASSAQAQSYRSTPQFSWTGCYIGGSVGGTWTRAESGVGKTHSDGFIGGGQLGCDYQFATNWLVGIQGEFLGTDVGSKQNYPNTFLGFPIGSGVLKIDPDWIASATARLGYTNGPWLYYAKGGAAWVRNHFNDTGTFFGPYEFSGKETQGGWTVGAGIECSFAPNWSLFAEYNFYDFGNNSATLTGAGASETFSIKQDFSAIKIGLNYRFGYN